MGLSRREIAFRRNAGRYFHDFKLKPVGKDFWVHIAGNTPWCEMRVEFASQSSLFDESDSGDWFIVPTKTVNKEGVSVLQLVQDEEWLQRLLEQLYNTFEKPISRVAVTCGPTGRDKLLWEWP
jgi:hypothetical protein